MNYAARQILRDFEALEVWETSIYGNRAASQRSHLFRTYGFDVATTEREYLEFIHNLILLVKPRKVLESGTGCGLGTLLIAAALKDCERQVVQCVAAHQCPKEKETYSPLVTSIETYSPVVISIDTRFCKGVESLARKYKISGPIRLFNGETLGWLQKFNKSEGEASLFDFCIFDSTQEQKSLEAAFMLQQRLLAKNAILVFHDTSFSHELKETLSYLTHLRKLVEEFNLQRLDFPWSRGLTIMRYQG